MSPTGLIISYASDSQTVIVDATKHSWRVLMDCLHKIFSSQGNGPSLELPTPSPSSHSKSN